MPFILSSAAVVPILTCLYAAAGIVFVLTDYTLNNEGLLTHYWASWARQDFAPVFFYQKVKPVLCTLYAPISLFGSRATLMAHVVVAATAIPLMAGTARALGYRLANFSAMVVALSPFYFYGGAAGFSNIDGVVGIGLVLYLLTARRSSLLAGIVAGLLPWVRFELVTFSAIMALYALLTPRRRRMLMGIAVFPLAYGAAGALYHRDLLWLQHFPPSVPLDPNNPIYGGQHIGLRFLLEPTVVLTPAAALIAGLPLRRLTRLEYTLLGYTVATALAMNVLPILGLGNFGSSQRYSLHMLPALALLGTRAIEPWLQRERPQLTAVCAVGFLAVWIAAQRSEPATAVALIAIYGALLAAAWWRAGRIVWVVAVCLAAIGLVLPLRIEALRSVTASYLMPMVAWLEARPDLYPRAIYTNAQLLAPVLERRAAVSDIYHLAGVDMARELIELTNSANGQRERILHLCAMDLYGKTLLPPIQPDDVPRDTLMVLRKDPRLPLLLPEATWSSRLEVIAEEPEFRIARVGTDIGTPH